MELRRLEYFVAVARHGQFTRAAEELWITQSALSQQVRRLEAELGVTLLRRAARGAELTPAGEELLPRAEAILAEVARARAELDRHAGVTRGRVRVALLAEQPLRVLLAPDDPLAGADAVALADLRGRPFILAEPGAALRETVMTACQAAGFSPVPLFEVSDPATVRFLAHAGLGVSVVPASWVEPPGPELAAPELAGPAPRHRVALLVPAGRETPAGRLLREALLQDLGAR